MKNTKTKKDCISYDLFYRYLEGRVTKTETRMIESHLNSCETCFHEMASLVRNSLFPATESEKIEIAKISTITQEEQVSKILTVVENECPPNSKVKISPIVKVIRGGKNNFEKWISFKYDWRPVFAPVIIMIIIIFIIGSYLGIKYYNTEYQIT